MGTVGCLVQSLEDRKGLFVHKRKKGCWEGERERDQCQSSIQPFNHQCYGCIGWHRIHLWTIMYITSSFNCCYVDVQQYKQKFTTYRSMPWKSINRFIPQFLIVSLDTVHSTSNCLNITSQILLSQWYPFHCQSGWLHNDSWNWMWQVLQTIT